MKKETTGRRWFFLAALTAILFGLVYWRSVDLLTPFIMGDDSSQYFLLSRSILQGEGYRSIWVDGSPPHAKFPFGFPLLLAAASGLAPGWPAAAFLVPVISGAGTVLMVFCLLRSREAPLFAWGIAVLTGMSALMCLYVNSLFSEVPFLFFLMSALFFADRFIREQRPGMPVAFGLVVCVLGTFFIRTAGACLVLALMAMLLGKAQWRVSKLTLIDKMVTGAVLVPILAWIAVSFVWTADSGDSYGLLLLKYIDPVKGIVEPGSFTGELRTFFKGVYALFFYAVPAALTNTKFLGRTLLAGMISTLAALGWWASFRRYRGILEVFCVCYLLGLAVWPWVQSSGVRMVFPVLPLLFYYFFEGVRMVALHIPSKKWGTALMITILAVFMASNIWHGPFNPRPGAVGKEAGGMGRAFSWIRRETPASALFLSPVPASLYLYTGRRTVFGPPLYASSDDEAIKFFQQKPVDYVFDPKGVIWQRNILGSLREDLTLVYEVDGQRIYKVRRDQ